MVIEGDRILDAVHAITGKSEEKLQERAEWWMEEGQDEFVPLSLIFRSRPTVSVLRRQLVRTVFR